MKTIVATIVLACISCAIAKDTPVKETAMVAKPPLVTREEWGSKPQPIDDKHKHTPKYITIHHAGVAWKTGRDPADFVRNVQAWGQRRVAENEALPPEKQKKNIENWPDL